MENVFFISKKIIPSLILIAILFSFTPNTTFAFVDNVSYEKLCAAGGGSKIGKGIEKGIKQSLKLVPVVKTGVDIAGVVTGVDIVGVGSISNPIPCFKYMLAFTVAWLGNGAVSLGEYAANSNNSLFKATLNKLTSDAYTITKPSKTFGDAIVKTHDLVREWANILIVLGFIGVALAFIFNLDQYKKLLVPMLIVALLINFIGVFVGLVIDTASIIMGQFVAGAGGSGNIVYKISEAWNKTLHTATINSIEEAFIYLGLSLGLAFAYLLIAVTFLTLSVIFIERFAILAILFVLSPLAFVFYVFPFAKAKDLFKSWWEHFLKWSFIGLIGIFFIYLAANVAVALGNVFNFKEVTNFKNVSDVYGELFFYLFITIFFLIIGMRITFKASGWASGIVIGAAVALATGGIALGAKAGLGAAKAFGKGAGRATGITPAAEWVGEGAKRARDFLAGTTITGRKTGLYQQRLQERNQAKIKEPLERMENLDNKSLARNAISGRAYERAAATTILKKRNKLSEIDPAYQGIAMRNAMAHDNRLMESDFAESHFEFARHDKKKVDEAMKRRGITNKSVAEDFVVREQLANNLPGMKDKDRANIDKDYLTDEFIAENFTPNIVRSFKTAKTSVRARIINSTRETKKLARKVAPKIKDAATGRMVNNPNADPAEYNRLRNQLRAIKKHIGTIRGGVHGAGPAGGGGAGPAGGGGAGPAGGGGAGPAGGGGAGPAGGGGAGPAGGGGGGSVPSLSPKGGSATSSSAGEEGTTPSFARRLGRIVEGAARGAGKTAGVVGSAGQA